MILRLVQGLDSRARQVSGEVTLGWLPGTHVNLLEEIRTCFKVKCKQRVDLFLNAQPPKLPASLISSVSQSSSPLLDYTKVKI